MSDNGSGTPLRNVDKTIEEALEVWEKFGFKDVSLWETFQYDFESFTEEDFKSASIHHQRKLRDYLRKYGVWVRKQQRYTIARSLYDALLEEEPTDWTETEIMACKPKEEFASYYIKQLLDSDFGRKPQISTTGPPPAPAPLASPSPTPGPSAPIPAYAPIHPTQPSGIGPTPETYGTPAALGTPAPSTSGTGPTRGAYMQHTEPKSAAYTQPSGIGATPAAYATAGGHTQPSSTGPAPAVKPIVNPASAVDPPPAMTTASTGHTPTSLLGPPAAATSSISAPFASSSVSPTPLGEAPVSTSSASPTPASINASTILPSTTAFIPPPTPPTGTGPAPAVTTTSTGHGRELSNLAKMYTEEAKYSGRNDSFTFKLAIFHDSCARADVPPEAKMKAFPTMLKGLALDYYFRISASVALGRTGGRDSRCYALRWMR